VNGRSFVHDVNIIHVKPSETQLQSLYHPYLSIHPRSARLADSNRRVFNVARRFSGELNFVNDRSIQRIKIVWIFAAHRV